VTLSRNQAALLALLVVIATGVWIAIRYVDEVFKEQKRREELIIEGNSKELSGQPTPPRPPAQPPLDRPATRGTEVIVLVAQGLEARTATDTRPPRRRKVVVVRGNGEFVRLPSAGEPGPVVTGIIDRATVDELARAVTGGLAEADRGDAYDARVALGAGQPSGSGLNRNGARRLLELSGKSLNKSAAPEWVQLETAPAEVEATEPWPFPRAVPETFAPGKRLESGPDRAKFRESLLRLLDPKAVFSHAGKAWKVAALDLIP
jgi:hypothetical protein